MLASSTSPTYPTTPGPLTAEEVAGTVAISSLTLSPDGQHVAYCVGPRYRTGDHTTSALWIARTSVEESARQITSGSTHDYAPSFHPTSGDIYFLSATPEAGGISKIYRLPGNATTDTEPTGAVDLMEGQSVSSYEISPDGITIAFTAKTSKADEKRNTIRIWRDKSDRASLYLADLPAHVGVSTARALVSTDDHVESFSWCPDSRSLLFRSTSHADQESLYGEHVREAIFDIASGTVHSHFTHPCSTRSKSIPRECGDIVFLQNKSPDVFFSSQSVWARGDPTTTGGPAHIKYGTTDDALRIVNLGHDSRYVVAVARGMDTALDVFDVEHNSRTVYETRDDHISDWDMKLIGVDRYAFVVLRSSGVRGEPLEIWAGIAEAGLAGKVMHKLTSHNTWLSRERMPMSRLFSWTSPDGQDVQGVIAYPRGAAVRSMPTVAVVHGGPYSRDTLDLSFQEWSWRHFLASQGYLVLSPNYRGSTGRGDKFAQAANGGMGTTDWMDVQSMIDQSIAEGMTDPDRVAIAGYSQGGFLTAWGISRTSNIFKAAVNGAGITDWGMLTGTSALPDLEAALGGGALWTPGETLYLRGSPIRDCKNVRTPLLLLHGEQDRIVPLSQAIAFLRGVERVGHPEAKPTLVIYPGEDHKFQQRVNAEDVLRRLAQHIGSYLH
ncbi:alpha/beta-hydrolase [Daedalea quercina L-15889]|uniref:Dipeptidyl-peptidase V n=1 Tax=Daedalea quercina L-15889 TaxID=1314783 RepID=A0A165MJB3_9APHY|nr:alpha/beta-hydrolase [Daedalea quercina L-15889]